MNSTYVYIDGQPAKRAVFAPRRIDHFRRKHMLTNHRQVIGASDTDRESRSRLQNLILLYDRVADHGSGRIRPAREIALIARRAERQRRQEDRDA